RHGSNDHTRRRHGRAHRPVRPRRCCRGRAERHPASGRRDRRRLRSPCIPHARRPRLPGISDPQRAESAPGRRLLLKAQVAVELMKEVRMNDNDEHIFDIAQLAHVELLTPELERSTWFFKDLIGLQETTRDGQSVYLRAYEDFYHHTLKLTEAPAAGLGHVAW